MKKILLSIAALLTALGGGYSITQMGARNYVPSQVVLDSVTAATTSTTLPTGYMTKDFRHVIFAVETTANATATIKFVGSIQDNPMDPTATSTITNQWDYIAVTDLQNGAGINGDTGVTFSGTNDHRMFEAEINALSWVMPIITSYTTGTINVSIIGASNL